MCLAIPGRVVEIVDGWNRIAKVDVGGMSKINEEEAAETLRLLEELGS